MISPRHFVVPCALLLVTSCAELVRNYRPQGNAAAGDGAVSFASSAARGTLLSLVRQPLTTATLGGTVLLQRPRELLVGNLPHFGTAAGSLTDPPGTPGFEALLDREHIPQPAAARLTWLVDGSNFFPEMERQIRNARQSVDCHVYIFDNDDIAVRLADLLKQRSSSTSVRVLFDDLGSSTAAAKAPKTAPPPGFKAPPDMLDYLRQGSRVQARRLLNPWLVCDHTKLFLFDGKTALMGSANVGREYVSEWHDLLFRVEGPAVSLLQEDFHHTWREASPLDAFRKRPAVITPPPPPGAVPIRVMRTDPAVGRFEIRTSLLVAIRAARRRIWIENPYISNDDLTGALLDAARRGVDVRLIYPGTNDTRVMDLSNRAFADALVKAGGKAYAYPRMTHMKVILCDGWACVGSANLDTLSMRINRELNIALSAPSEVERLATLVFHPDFRASKPHTLDDAPAPGAALAEAAADQL